jgi:predicted porin
MKKTLAVMAIAGVFAPALAQAQTNVTIYGTIDTSIDRVDKGSTTIQQNNNASRLGFKGTEDLGSGLKAAFGIEFGFNSDNGTFSGTVSGNTATVNAFRNTYVGLVGNFGAVAMGRLDSANPTGSPLYTQITRILPIVAHDAGVVGIGTNPLRGRNRVSNAIGYKSPEFGGFVGRARYYQQGPDTPTGTGLGVINEDDFKSIDLGLDYTNGPLAAGVGYGQDKKRGGYLANDFKNKWQLLAAYDFKFMRVSGFYGRDNHNNTATARDTVNYWLLGAKIPVGAADAIVGNYMQRQVQTDKNGTEKRWQIGYHHVLSKRTMLYAAYDYDDPNNNANVTTVKALSLGVKHTF